MHWGVRLYRLAVILFGVFSLAISIYLMAQRMSFAGFVDIFLTVLRYFF